MRKTITGLLAASMVFGALALPQAQAGKKKKAPKRTERVMEASYQGPAVGVAGGGICSPNTLGCFGFPLGAGERYINVDIVDTVPAGVFASVTQDLDGDTFADTSVDICGSSAEPIQVEEGYEVTVFLWEGPGVTTDGAPCPGVVTQGTITATISNLP
ncbi:MAG TPA: hypothetical protein VG318_11800 [Actinomycetota bacterium]|nr:hypothetical protein [Actinomycetota bacterium]